MAELPFNLLSIDARSEWVRLRTLINLRWLAIVGQVGAVAVATMYLGLLIDVGLCLMAIGASVVFNVISMFVYPANKRLSERESMLTLLFDMSQLVFLLYLTGGLSNPFALLILAPVTISATALRLQSTIFLGSSAIALISIVAAYNVPLRSAEGELLHLPELFIYGFWIALAIGVVFLGAYARRVAQETHTMSQALIATQAALSREQKLTDLGGVVAAAAHEFGTPLATIKLASSELIEELADDPLLREDAELIRDQADRCRDILRDMGRAGKDDLHLHHAPISAVVREAAEPHEGRGKEIHLKFEPAEGSSGAQPNIRRHPEIIHGLRNLVQNAVDFAEANVWVDVRWSDDSIFVTVSDDGPGYPPDLIGRIGDPFVRKRGIASDKSRRPEYEGMGLGLFISKTLLERSGAELAFANGVLQEAGRDQKTGRTGAIAEVVWRRTSIEQTEDSTGPLGQNPPFEP